jgi:hypothetical protein
MVKRGETCKPGYVFLLASIGRLRRSGFTSDYNVFQTGSAAGPPVFINNFPQTLPNEFHILGGDLVAKLGPNARCEINGLALFIDNWRVVLVKYLVDQTRVITGAAVGRGDICHGQLQRGNQCVALTDRNIGRLRLRPAFPRMMNFHPFRAGHVTGLFTGQVQARFLADSQQLANDVNRLNASRISVLIEKRIA